MAAKSTTNLLSFIFSKQFLKHFAIALGSLLVLAIVVLQCLRFYTNHGEFVEVPNLKDVPLADAISLLEKEELKYEVIDSVFLPDRKPGIVVEQTPAANEKIKRYREIYLTINSCTKPQLSLPDVRDLSYRHAAATLEASGFKVAKVEYVPSEYRDLVKDVKFGGQPVLPGSKIPHGSSLTLVVGKGLSSSVEIAMPSFRRLDYASALAQINGKDLSLRSVQFDETPRSASDSAAYVVYAQSPVKGTPVPLGSSVSIWLTKNKKLLDSAEEEFSAADTVKSTRKVNDVEEFSF